MIAGRAVSAREVTLDDGWPMLDITLEGAEPIGRAFDGRDISTLRVAPAFVKRAEALVGQDPLVFVKYTREGHMIVSGGPSGLWRSEAGVAMSADMDPLVEQSCTGHAVVARPTDQAPIAPDEPVTPEQAVAEMSARRVFADRPSELGMRWADLREGLTACVVGAQAVAGGVE